MGEEKRVAGSVVGEILDDRYRIESLLGEGGMGAVYSATDLRLDKPVAVKMMTRELSANPDALARFHREARVTSALGHPHIVQVLDFNTTATGEPFLVMEFLEGEDLDRRLRREGRFFIATVVHIVKQVASALAAAHAKGIVHRDLKPANVYLLEVAGEREFVKVLDFGISKVRSAATKLTRTASIMGSPSYMSPEQARGKVEDIDERTDQWALACIAWECLTGEGPFSGESVPSILFQIVHEPPPEAAGLEAPIKQVLLRALMKEKQERFPGMAEFAAALEAASGIAVTPPPSSIFAPARMPATVLETNTEEKIISSTTFTQTAGQLKEDASIASSWSKRRLLAVTAGAALVLLVAAFLLLRPTRTSNPLTVTPPLSKPTPATNVATAQPPPTPVAATTPPATAPQPTVPEPKTPTGRPASAASPGGTGEGATSPQGPDTGGPSGATVSRPSKEQTRSNGQATKRSSRRNPENKDEEIWH